MSEKELRRGQIQGRVQAAELSQREAAGRLGLSYQQVKRLWRRYRRQGAKGYVEQEYLPQHNARYAVSPRSPVDIHEPVSRGPDLDEAFCLEYERVVSNDCVVQYKNRYFQLEPSQPVKVSAGSHVTVRPWLNGRLKLLAGAQLLRWHELEARPEAEPRVRLLIRCGAADHKPAPDHPWRCGLVGPPAPPKLCESWMIAGEGG